MSLLKKLEICKGFSDSEKSIAAYILKNGEVVLNMSTTALAQETYTSPATIVRLCKKLDYKGYNEFKIALAGQFQHQHILDDNINPNFPFQKHDTVHTIAYNIANLNKEVIDQTMHLLDSDVLQKVIQLLYKAMIIDVYGVSGPLRIAEDFQYKMFRIGRSVHIVPMVNEQLFQAAQSNQKHCALLISYSGETDETVHAAKILKQKGIPMIAITSIGDNQLSKYCQYVLYLSPNERIYSKISTFGSTMAIHLLLDIIYAGIFMKDYDKNIDFKMETDRQIDHRHSSIVLFK